MDGMKKSQNGGKIMSKYSLIGVDGNAFSLMAYTSNALKAEGLNDLISEMKEKAMSSDYNNLIMVCDEYVQLANKAVYEDGCEDWDD